jgi:hypothetical protein
VISRSKLAEEEAESVLKPTGPKPIRNLSGLLNKLEKKLTAASFMTGKPSTTEPL